MNRSRIVYAVGMAFVVAAGLLWRSGVIPLSPFLHKYGGDALWALLIFLGVGFLFCRSATWRVGLMAFSFCCVVEFTQLYHAPWIDAMRGTRLGVLVLGSTFNSPDFAAYAFGIVLGVVVEIVSGRRKKL